MTGNKGNRGFTIFFAVLVSTLALAIGVAIYDLTVRELELSATADQSQFAIYAADAGAECALYWDTKCELGACFAGSIFATSTDSSPPSSGAQCNGNDIIANGKAPDPYALPASSWDNWTVATAPSSATTTFWMALSSSVAGPCAQVEVNKRGSPVRTTITAHGYNTCVVGPATRLERILQVTY